MKKYESYNLTYYVLDHRDAALVLAPNIDKGDVKPLLNRLYEFYTSRIDADFVLNNYVTSFVSNDTLSFLILIDDREGTSLMESSGSLEDFNNEYMGKRCVSFKLF